MSAADILLGGGLVLFFAGLLTLLARDFIATWRAPKPDSRPVTARMPPARPQKVEPYDVRYARNVAWLRRHPGQP